jgi:DNA-binding MarR family transcriptional regulator
MLALWERDNIKVKDLGERMFLDSGTLTPLLKKLESAGYVSRVRDESDERNVYIKLTPEGSALKEAALDIPKKLLCSVYEGKEIDKKSASELLGSLHSLMDTLKE